MRGGSQVQEKHHLRKECQIQRGLPETVISTGNTNCRGNVDFKASVTSRNSDVRLIATGYCLGITSRIKSAAGVPVEGNCNLLGQ